MLNQPRNTQRYESKPRDDEPALVKQMLEVARRRPRWGYRRVAWALRQEEWQASAHGCTGFGVGRAESTAKEAEKATTREE